MPPRPRSAIGRAEQAAQHDGRGAVHRHARELVVERDVEEVAVHRDGRVVHEQPDLEVRGRVRELGPDLRTAEVGDDGAGLHAVLAAHLGCDLAQELLAAGDHHDVEAAIARPRASTPARFPSRPRRPAPTVRIGRRSPSSGPCSQAAARVDNTTGRRSRCATMNRSQLSTLFDLTDRVAIVTGRDPRHRPRDRRRLRVRRREGRRREPEGRGVRGDRGVPARRARWRRARRGDAHGRPRRAPGARRHDR